MPLPPLDAVLLATRRVALGAFLAAGWSAWTGSRGLDAERRRLLNLDLSEPDVAFTDGSDIRAVAHVEVDREGAVTHVEIVGAEPADPLAVALALAGEVGPPRAGGGVEAREWVWGPESGARIAVAGEPVRLWVCAERAYGDRLWAIASVVRHA